MPCQNWSSVLSSEGYLEIQMIDLTSDVWNSWKYLEIVARCWSKVGVPIAIATLLQMFLSHPNTSNAQQDVFFPHRRDVPIVQTSKNMLLKLQFLFLFLLLLVLVLLLLLLLVLLLLCIRMSRGRMVGFLATFCWTLATVARPKRNSKKSKARRRALGTSHFALLLWIFCRVAMEIYVWLYEYV